MHQNEKNSHNLSSQPQSLTTQLRPSQINDYNDNLKSHGINPKSKATTSFGLSEGS